MIYHLVTISYFYIENIIVFEIEIPLRFITEINAKFVVFIFVGKVNIIPLFIIVFLFIILYCIVHSPCKKLHAPFCNEQLKDFDTRNVVIVISKQFLLIGKYCYCELSEIDPEIYKEN